MAASTVPKTMRAWQYSSVKGGLENNLKLNTVPMPKPTDSQHLVQVIAAALNPIDYKPAELPVVGGFIVKKPATPGDDFAGRIVIPAKNSPLKVGDIVYGASGTNPPAGGALAEYAISESKNCVPLPEGLDPVGAATVCVCGMTAYQSIVTRTKPGDRVFINGGSGGTGVFGVQLAKAAGLHVTTTCSTKNVEFVKSLGADEVIDYTKGSVLEALKASEHKFNHAVDNIGSNRELVWRSHDYLVPGASYITVGGELSAARISDSVKRKITPSFLGGIKRNVEGFWPSPKKEDLTTIGTWMKEGKVKPIIDSRFPFEEAPEAIRKLKTGRARGKIVIDMPASGS